MTKYLIGLMLVGCTGTADLQCPGPFGYYSTELDSCPDRAFADSAIDILGTVGLLTFDPAKINVTILDVNSWVTAGGARVEGLTTLTDTYVDKSQVTLLHELIHVQERPGINPSHSGWLENGYKGLDNFFYWYHGTNSAIWQTVACVRPLMLPEQETALKSAGYDIDTWKANIDCSP